MRRADIAKKCARSCHFTRLTSIRRRLKAYFNSDGTPFQPIQDTAFSTCP